MLHQAVDTSTDYSIVCTLTFVKNVACMNSGLSKEIAIIVLLSMLMMIVIAYSCHIICTWPKIMTGTSHS